MGWNKSKKMKWWGETVFKGRGWGWAGNTIYTHYGLALCWKLVKDDSALILVKPMCHQLPNYTKMLAVISLGSLNEVLCMGAAEFGICEKNASTFFISRFPSSEGWLSLGASDDGGGRGDCWGTGLSALQNLRREVTMTLLGMSLIKYSRCREREETGKEECC